jgi:hypothetical protein
LLAWNNEVKNIGEKLQKLGYTNVKNLYLESHLNGKNEGNSLTNMTNDKRSSRIFKNVGKYLKKGI